MSVFSNFFALILSRNYLWLVVFSLFNCGDISAVRVKIRRRRPSVSRRCADEKAVTFPCRTPKYPADGNRGTCRGIFSRGNHQGLRGESLSASGKFSCCGTQNRRSLVLSLPILTTATHSAPFLCPRQRSPHSPIPRKFWMIPIMRKKD